jgi:microcystin-dependent protein
MYGGNGQTTFALPDCAAGLRSAIGQGFTQGQAGGQETHTLTQSEMPTHIHFMSAVTGGRDSTAPSNNWLARIGH